MVGVVLVFAVVYVMAFGLAVGKTLGSVLRPFRRRKRLAAASRSTGGKDLT